MGYCILLKKYWMQPWGFWFHWGRKEGAQGMTNTLAHCNKWSLSKDTWQLIWMMILFYLFPTIRFLEASTLNWSWCLFCRTLRWCKDRITPVISKRKWLQCEICSPLKSPKQTFFFYYSYGGWGKVTVTKEECLWTGWFNLWPWKSSPGAQVCHSHPSFIHLLCSPRDWQRLLGKTVPASQQVEPGNRSAYLLQKICHHYFTTEKLAN